jgi:ankyrin repeat protein
MNPTSDPGTINEINAMYVKCKGKDGHVNVVRELLERGANVNATTKKGNAAIHIASLGEFRRIYFNVLK